MSLPAEVIDVFGYALHLAQSGKKHDQAKPLRGLGAGVLEVVGVAEQIAKELSK